MSLQIYTYLFCHSTGFVQLDVENTTVVLVSTHGDKVVAGSPL